MKALLECVNCFKKCFKRAIFYGAKFCILTVISFQNWIKTTFFFLWILATMVTHLQ